MSAIRLCPFYSITQSAMLAVLATTANIQIPAVSASSSLPLVSVRIVNSGTNPVFCNFGATSGVTAVIPTAGTPQSGVMLLPNTEKTFSVPDGWYLAAIASATGNTLYVSAGESE